MTYKFTKFQVGRFTVHKANPHLGDEHRKRFTDFDITPNTQATFNIYAVGEFSFGVEGGTPLPFHPGSTSLSYSPDTPYEKGVIYLERVTSENATRYCVAPTIATKWRKREVTLEAGESLNLVVNGCAFVLIGAIVDDILPDENRFITGYETITAKVKSVLAVME